VFFIPPPPPTDVFEQQPRVASSECENTSRLRHTGFSKFWDVIVDHPVVLTESCMKIKQFQNKETAVLVESPNQMSRSNWPRHNSGDCSDISHRLGVVGIEGYIAEFNRKGVGINLKKSRYNINKQLRNNKYSCLDVREPQCSVFQPSFLTHFIII